MPKRKYTESEWARIQSRLPQEDRVPYSQSPMVPTTAETQAALAASIQESKAGSAKASETLAAVSADIPEIGTAGVSAAEGQVNIATNNLAQARTPEEIAAAQAAVDAANAAFAAAKSNADALIAEAERLKKLAADAKTAAEKAAAQAAADKAAAEAKAAADKAAADKAAADKAAADKAAADKAAADKAAAEAKAKADALAERKSAFDLLYEQMDALGLASLVEPLRGLIQQDVSAAEFAIKLRGTEAYKNRFRANEGRTKKGLRALTPGEYIRVEDAYRQTLRTYGLKQFDNDQYVSQFIENDISAAELSDRVATAVQRVQNADPAIGRTLRDYYGIGQNDLVAYVLDPNQQLQKIQRQVAAAEIGTAARKQGLEAGVTVSEQLAAQGITQAEAQRGYATIADILPTAEKLSGIYGTTLDKYGQVEGEQEVFNELASAQRKRQRLIGREVAEFSGQSGISRGALGTSTGGQY